MEAIINNNELISLNNENLFGYTITNWDDTLFNIFDVNKVDSNNNKKIIITNIDEELKTCHIIINPLYTFEYE